jgi:hypothetical protein
LKRFWQGVSLLAILFYLAIGASLIFSNLFERLIEANYRKPLGIVMVLYGFYRIARYFMLRKAESNENRD